MNTTPQTTQNQGSETERIEPGREGFSGRLLHDTRYHEGMAITHIVEGEIHYSGMFREKMGDYAFAYSRSQKMDIQRAENIIRDLYKARVGETMNQTRERLMAREEALTDEDRATGYEHAVRIGERVEHGVKIAFSRAYAGEAQAMAQNLGITHNAARKIMAEEFEAAENMPLRDWGKELDAQHFQPQIEAEKEERARNRGQTRTAPRAPGNNSASSEQQNNADTGWDHAQDVADAGERPAGSAVPRTGARTQQRSTRGYDGPTRSGP